jgi:hypothetical protein
MRSGAVLVTLSLLLGATPALAQADSIPYPLGRETPAAAAPTPKAVAKPKAALAMPVLAKPEPKKAESQKPAEAKLAIPKLPLPRPQAAITPAAATLQAAVAKTETAKAEPAPDAFAGVPLGERLKIQAALLWSGDYAGAVNGEDPMLTAIKNYQKRSKGKITGVLTPTERANLLAAARDHEQEFGWSVVVDPATGIRIGLPVKMVPNAREAARGTRWSSAHGDVQVETFRIADANLKLSALFEQEKKEPGTRKVEYSVLRDDNFFISGLQGLKKFSVRAYIRNGEVRGFTILYDQMMETIVAPVTVAMAAAFSPFPERSAPFAALAKSVEYGSGLVVSAQGHIVTDRKLTEGCQVIVASGLGDAVRIADDRESGLALLRVFGPRQLSALALPRDAAKSGELTLVGIADPKEQDGSRKLTEIKARLLDGNSIELRQPVPMAGFSGAAALDGQGRFLGMMEMRNAVLASIEPAAPPVRLVTADAIRGFLEAHNVAPAQTQTGDANASVVRMICVRK